MSENNSELQTKTNLVNTTSDAAGQPILVSSMDTDICQKRNAYLKRHIQYEYDMLNLTMDCWYFLQEPKSELSEPIRGVVVNALVESFLIHFRALYDFLELPRHDKNGVEFTPKAKGDDVVASHYVNRWQDIRPDCTNLLKNCRKRIDKELVHITDKRQTDPVKKQWSFIKMGKEIQRQGS